MAATWFTKAIACSVRVGFVVNELMMEETCERDDMVGFSPRNATPYHTTRHGTHLGAEAPDDEVEVVDVAEADDRHHALPRQQGVEHGGGVAEVKVLLCVFGV